MSAPLIEARGVGRRHPKIDEWLLRDVDLAVARGERVGLVGRSGAGKTLLLRTLAWLDPTDLGVVCWNGRPVEGKLVPSYRARVIYLHQRPALGDGTVLENLQSPFGMQSHATRRFDRDRAIATLESLGRDERFLEKSVRDLSGGEAQITAVARALGLAPEVLLLDEPTASLDRASAEAVERTVIDWWSERAEERALVWVGHDLEQTGRITDRQVMLEAGRIDRREKS